MILNLGIANLSCLVSPFVSLIASKPIYLSLLTGVPTKRSKSARKQFHFELGEYKASTNCSSSGDGLEERKPNQKETEVEFE